MDGKQKIAIVTGASRGIGQSITERLRQQNVFVIGISRVNEASRADKWVKCDVRCYEEVQNSIRKIREDYERIDILVNSAGIAEYAPLTETSPEMWNNIINVNLSGTFYTMREVLPVMLKQNSGRIINIASIAAKRGDAQAAAYSATKHAIIGLTHSAALEAAKTGVTVNAVCPGAVKTRLLEDGLAQWSKKTGRPVEVGEKIYKSSTPQNRFFGVDEVSALVFFLTTDAAYGINGQSINLCGGALAL
jgi:3-hydroxybutyrate dehydrogenase